MLLRRAAAAATAVKRSSVTPVRAVRHVGAAGRGHATTSSPPRRRGHRRAPSAESESLTATALPRPFPDYHPLRPDSPEDDSLARRLAAVVISSPHPGTLPPLPFLPLLRPIHLLLALQLIASDPDHGGLLLPLLLLFPLRRDQQPHPHLLRCFAVAAHLAAARGDSVTARAILVRAVRFPSPHRHFVEHFITTYKAFSSDPASFDLLLQCLPSAPLLRRLRQYGISPSPEACNAVLSRLPLDGAIELFQELPDKNVCSYNILLKALCGAGHVEDAHQLFDKMELRPDVATYGILVHGYCALGELESAVKLLDEMVARGMNPNATVYTSVVALLCDKGRVSDALRVVEDMVQHKVILDEAVYTTVLSGFCSKGDLAAARRWFDKMQKSGLATDGVTYTTLINGLCRAGELKEAEKVLHEMLARQLDVDEVTYTVLVDGYCKTGKMAEAFRVHNTMVQRGVIPNVVTYTALSDGLCKQGDVQAANELLHEMCNKGLELNACTYNSLINGLCKSGNLEQAMKTMADMDTAGRVGGGKKLLEWMLERNVHPNAVTYNSLMKQYCIGNNMKSATEIYKRMNSLKVAPNENTYNILVKGHSKARNMKEALHFHNEMIEKGFRLTATSYNSLIRLLNKKKKFVEARKLFDEMRTEGLAAEPDVYNFYIDFNFNEDNLESTLALCDELVEASIVKSKAEMDQDDV
ncbi:pentatricopeptide repeat-containing protein At1g05670, mitochondrial-like isoform X2 [Panicum virgatum]|uniref:pentatricopeptide repeat-containing protein At1g05670, mitochondrial-like isoform X2 n=1 Tax=Panicum virgatum TaxID=38727 RepID=UPI0019D56ACF|nr:pentatricopeptide repeat-containing protein At1g05670, mitochondrial-like isoform X2 [Panicum virgatum]